MDLFAYSLLFGAVISGGALAIFLKNKLQRSLKILLAFSGAYLLAVCVLHLVPEVHASDADHIGIFILGGFVFQLLLEFFSDGIEHGHVHLHEAPKNSFPIAIMVSLCLHSFFEGMPLESELHNHHQLSEHSDHSLLYGIVLHKLPIAIALTTMLLQAGLSRVKVIFWLIWFALMAPLGAWFTHSFSDVLESSIHHFVDHALAIVVGMFLHISTTILFESSEGHKFNLLKLGLILSAFSIAYFTL